MSTFIPGYQTSYTIELTDIGIYGNVLSIRRSKSAPKKPVFGTQAQQAISGQTSASISAAGHVAVAGPIADLWSWFESEVPVSFAIQIGELGGTTDGGILDGDMVVTSLEISTDAEGEFEWSLSGDVDGAIAHTPAV